MMLIRMIVRTVYELISIFDWLERRFRRQPIRHSPRNDYEFPAFGPSAPSWHQIDEPRPRPTRLAGAAGPSGLWIWMILAAAGCGAIPLLTSGPTPCAVSTENSSRRVEFPRGTAGCFVVIFPWEGSTSFTLRVGAGQVLKVSSAPTARVIVYDPHQGYVGELKGGSAWPVVGTGDFTVTVSGFPWLTVGFAVPPLGW